MNIDALTPYFNYYQGQELSWCHQTIINAIKLYRSVGEVLDQDKVIRMAETAYGVIMLYLAAGGTVEQEYTDELALVVADGIINYYPKSRQMFGDDLDESYPEVPQPETKGDFKVWVKYFINEGFSLNEIYQMTYRGMSEYAIGEQEDIVETLGE